MAAGARSGLRAALPERANGSLRVDSGRSEYPSDIPMPEPRRKPEDFPGLSKPTAPVRTSDTQPERLLLNQHCSRNQVLWIAI